MSVDNIQLELSRRRKIKPSFFSKTLKFFSTFFFTTVFFIFIFAYLLSRLIIAYTVRNFEILSFEKGNYTEFINNNENLYDESWISKIDVEEIRKKVNFIIKGADVMNRYSRKIENSKYISYAGRNMLFYGPPGTGKSYLAKTIAKNISSHYLVVSSGSLQDTYIGSGARKIKNFFEEARMISSKEKKPVVIIFEEIDSIISEGKIVSKDDTLVNTFLSYVDKIVDLNDNVIIIGTTNEFSRIERAAKRSGRFQNIYFGYPSNYEWIGKNVNKVKYEIEKKYQFYVTNNGLEVNLSILPKFWSNLLDILSDTKYQEEKKAILKDEGLTFPLIFNYVEEKIFESILIAEENSTENLGIYVE